MRKTELSEGHFNHCASVCPYEDGVLIAWYAGISECHNEQSVYVAYCDDSKVSTPMKVGNGTGNPVLIPDGPILLWSKFEDSGYVSGLVDRWKYCSLWTRQIKLSGGETSFEGATHRLSSPDEHLLGRCNPIIDSDGSVILPLYDEMNANGVIFKGNRHELNRVGTIGFDMIQPTIWKDGDKYCSLSRNFKSVERYSQYSYSPDCVKWSKPESTSIPNMNSSLHVTRWNGLNFVLWNNTIGRMRKNLTLGIIVDSMPLSVIPIKLIDSYGAYPSMCVDKNNNLNIAYSTEKHRIMLCSCDIGDIK